MGMWRIRVGMQGIRVGMRGIRVGMRGIRLGMQGIGVRMSRGIKTKGNESIYKDIVFTFWYEKQLTKLI